MSINEHELQKLGNILKSKREKLGLSLKHISEATKIRFDYLEALEEGNYNKLPADVYTKGFVRNYSIYVGINPKVTLAFFRRENIKPKEKERIKEPSKINSSRSQFQLTPDRIIYIFLGMFVLIFLGYMLFRVTSVIQQPDFDLQDPIAIQGGESGRYETIEETITIRGNLEVGADLTLNDSAVDTRNLEIFEIPDINLKEGENLFNLTAINQFGIEQQITLTVVKTSEDEEAEQSPESEIEISDEMSIEISVGPREANVLLIVDGEEKINWVEASGTIKAFTGNNSISIQTPRPDSVELAINGEQYPITSSDTYEWRLIDGQIVSTSNL